MQRLVFRYCNINLFNVLTLNYGIKYHENIHILNVGHSIDRDTDENIHTVNVGQSIDLATEMAISLSSIAYVLLISLSNQKFGNLLGQKLTQVFVLIKGVKPI